MRFELRLPGWMLVALASWLAALTVAWAEPPQPDDDAVPVETARDRAKVLHGVYAATLEVMHDRYFHDEKAIVPARALEDVFAELSRQSKVEARWISVNTKPMGVRHEPKGEFELLAAKAIAAGQDEFQRVENGRYYRAAPIPLSDGCVACHTGFFAAQPKTPRFAGLVISVPVKDK